MSHTGAIPKYKQIDEYEGKGPRPPIPGEECRLPKMTECNSSAKRNYNCEPVAKWHKGLLNLLSDEIGVKLLYNYIETVAGKHHEYWHFLNFYFTCVGLKTKKDENEVRAIINSIYKKYHEIIPGMQLYHEVISRMINKSNPTKPDPNVFSELQADIVRKLEDGIYLGFFQSHIFIDYCNEVRQGEVPTISNQREDLFRNVSTIHEDTEMPNIRKQSHSRPIKLTEEVLRCTQTLRLNQVRPDGAHGYNNINFQTSYVPVTRQNSDKMSCSSGHNDSDGQSMTKDGQPRSHRRRTSECSSKKFAANYKINELTDSDVSMFRHPQIDDPLARLNAEPNKKCVLDVNELISKLERVKHEKDQGEAMRDGLEKLPHPSTDHAQLLAAVCQKIGPVMDDGEDILDAHLSRVGFSPKSLSGVTSPCQGQPPKLQPKKRMPPPPVLGGFNNISSLPKFTQSMKSSKSLPLDHTRSQRNPPINRSSANFDSGISMWSIESSRSRNSIKDQCPIDQQSLEDDARRYRRQPGQSQSNSLARINEHINTCTIAVYTFCDGGQKDVYRTKIPGTNPTLKQYKDYLPKKGNHKRFFFKTIRRDGAVLEEYFNDTDTLPIIEDNKVMGTIIMKDTMSRLNEQFGEYTTAIYTFNDEQISFRTKIPSSHPTLRQFINYLPKTGHFRFFFKTVCDEIGGPIHEEISNESDILPLFNGKIMGKIDPL